MAYRYDVSYPFLDVALRYDVDYGAVLAAAEFLKSSVPGSIMTPMIPPDAVLEIANLVALPVHQRGGRTDICDVCGAERRSGTFPIDCKMPCTTEELDKAPRGAKCLKFMEVH